MVLLGKDDAWWRSFNLFHVSLASNLINATYQIFLAVFAATANVPIEWSNWSSGYTLGLCMPQAQILFSDHDKAAAAAAAEQFVGLRCALALYVQHMKSH